MRTITVASLLLIAATAVVAEELFVPMVAQKSGQDGAWWNTELWVVNTTASTGTYGAVFLPSGQGNLAGLREEPVTEDIAPGATVYRNDLVPAGSVGTLRFIVTDGVVVFCRVYNSAGRGSFGQGMPALPASAATQPGEIAHLPGLRRTPQFRTNLTLFLPGEHDGLVRVRVLGAAGDVLAEEAYRVAPGGTLQLDDALHSLGVARGENLRAEVSGTVGFFVFASVIDSRSGAPTVVVPLH